MDTQVTGAPVETRPVLLAASGRGRVGKTEMLAVVAQLLAEDAGFEVEVWDCDPAREVGSLSGRFKGAKRPRSGDLEDRRIFLEEHGRRLMEAAVDGRPFHAVLDVGGEDLLLPLMDAEVGFGEFLSRAGVSFVVAHVVGTDDADLDYLRRVEKLGLIRATRGAIVRNEGMLRTTERRDAAFQRVNDDPVVRAFTSKARGGRLLSMPALAPDVMQDVKASGQTFREYATDPKRCWDFRAVRVAHWLAGCEEMRRAMLGP